MTFSVAPGEVVGLLGPNGSGKSTLFRILATLLEPTAGGAKVFGHDVVNDRLAARRRLGIVFQSPALDKELTARENLVYHGRLLGLDKVEAARRADRLLERVGLEQSSSQPTKRLSGGMRRRVEIARAMLDTPPLLLMDEPTVGLDPAARRNVWMMVNELRADLATPPTLLLSTHLMSDLESDAADCDRLILLNEGQVVANESPSALRSRVSGDVVTLVPEQASQAEALADHVRRTFQAEAIVTTGGGGGAVRIEREDGHELVASLLADRAALPVGVALREATVGRPTLEDVFIALTGRPLTM